VQPGRGERLLRARGAEHGRPEPARPRDVTDPRPPRAEQVADGQGAAVFVVGDKFTAGSLIFQFIIGFSLALLFNLRFPLRRLARSLIIIPWLLPLLITGFIFRFLFQAEAGAVNPPTPSFANYSAVFSAQGGHIASTLVIGVGTAILTLAIAVPAAHALARYRFRVTALLVGGLLIAQILPSIVIANSLFLLYHKLHLLNSYPGLILADASYAIPFSILVLRAFMLGLPNDVLQAARVDGASEWKTFLRVVLPMSRAAVREADPGTTEHGAAVRPLV
jgi:ABC-type spermidine/putrescine transport system permease subunit II